MKKITAVLLSVFLLFSLVGFTAYAQEEKINYLVIGDSIAYGSGLRNPKNAVYGKIIADTNDFNYVNCAIPGDTSKALSEEMHANLYDEIEKADVISISIGGNDFILGNLVGLLISAANGNYEPIEKIANTYYERMSKDILKTIFTLNPDVVVLLQNLYNPQVGFIGEVFVDAVVYINREIERLAEEFPNVYMVDVGTPLGRDRANFSVDCVHPSVNGNEIIAKQVNDKLFELGFAKTTDLVINEKGEDTRLDLTLIYRAIGLFVKIVSIIT